MASTYVPIASFTLASSAASVTFSGIPQTFTDLVVRASARGTRTGYFDLLYLSFNSDTSALYSMTNLGGNGSSAYSGRGSNSAGYPLTDTSLDTDNATSNTFSSHELYLPNYTGSAYKCYGSFGALETNATAADMRAVAGLYRSTTAISSITFSPGVGNLYAGCTFHLYGIRNS